MFKLFPAEFFGRKELGRISGLFQISGVAGTAVGPWILGMVYDATGSYWKVLYTFAFSGLFVSSLQVFMKPSKLQNNPDLEHLKLPGVTVKILP